MCRRAAGGAEGGGVLVRGGEGGINGRCPAHGAPRWQAGRPVPSAWVLEKKEWEREDGIDARGAGWVRRRNGTGVWASERRAGGGSGQGDALRPAHLLERERQDGPDLEHHLEEGATQQARGAPGTETTRVMRIMSASVRRAGVPLHGAGGRGLCVLLRQPHEPLDRQGRQLRARRHPCVRILGALSLTSCLPRSSLLLLLLLFLVFFTVPPLADFPLSNVALERIRSGGRREAGGRGAEG